MTFPCIKSKIHKYTNTQFHKVLKRPKCSIYLKSMGFKDIKYPVYQLFKCKIHKYAKYKGLKRHNKCYIFERYNTG